MDQDTDGTMDGVGTTLSDGTMVGTMVGDTVTIHTDTVMATTHMAGIMVGDGTTTLGRQQAVTAPGQAQLAQQRLILLLELITATVGLQNIPLPEELE